MIGIAPAPESGESKDAVAFDIVFLMMSGGRAFIRVGVGVGVVAAAAVGAAGFAVLSLASGCGVSTTMARPVRAAPNGVDASARVIDDGFVLRLRDANGTRDAAFVDDGFVLGSIAVVEEGTRRGVFDEDGAVRYERDDGASWFVAGERGVEEWSRVEVPDESDVVVLKWHFDGAALALALASDADGGDDAIAVEETLDRAQYVVTAPLAFGASGASYRPHLSIDNDDTIVVTVGGVGREKSVDVDSLWRSAGSGAVASSRGREAWVPCSPTSMRAACRTPSRQIGSGAAASFDQSTSPAARSAQKAFMPSAAARSAVRASEKPGASS